MNGNNILLDTNIILYLLGGDDTLIPFLEDKKIFVSFITQLELLAYKGLTTKEIEKINGFLSNCTIIDINNQIKDETLKIRRKHNLKLPDCIIIATSLYLNIPIISSDIEFKQVEEAELFFYQK